jgi:hypothetical protein
METMNNHELADFTYEKFGRIVGSEQIATKLALRLISDYVDESNPKKILEVGSGIGTITYLLSRKSPNASIYCFELNDWCCTQLVANVDTTRIRMLNTLEELLLLKDEVDLLVIDDWLDYPSTQELMSNTLPKSIFIEGHRRQQRLFVIKSLWKNRLPFILKNFRKSDDSYKGGCLIIVQSSSIFHQLGSFSLIYSSLVYSKILEVRSMIHFREILSRLVRISRD